MQIKKLLILILFVPFLVHAQYDNWLDFTNWLTKESEDRSPVAVWRADYGITTVDTGGTYPTVSNWLSTNGKYNAYQPTASKRPLFNTDSVALKFDGIDDYLFYNASNPNIFDPRTGDYSITAWIYVPFISEEHARYRYIVSKGYGASAPYPGFNVYIYTDTINNRINFNHRVSAFTNAIAYVSINVYNLGNAWYHIVISGDRDGELIMYINGVKKTSKDISAYKNDDIWSSYPFKIGTAHSNVNFYHSFISEVGYYKVALTQPEVEALYNAGRPQ